MNIRFFYIPLLFIIFSCGGIKRPIESVKHSYKIEPTGKVTYIYKSKERKYLIEGIEHSRFFGPYNSHFKIYKEKYPNLKLSSRGDRITIKGEEAYVNEFITAVESIVKYLKINKNVTLGDIERLVIGEENSKNGESQSDKGIIIHGQGGKIISARTKNQQELVDKVDKNDLVFAIGPAGTGKTYTAVALAVKALKNKEVKK